VYTPLMQKNKSRSAAPSMQTKNKPSIDFRTPTLGHSRGNSHLMLAREAVGSKSCYVYKYKYIYIYIYLKKAESETYDISVLRLTPAQHPACAIYTSMYISLYIYI
jgi:hypothetical protein